MEEKVIDCRGLSCPQPVVETKAAIESLSWGRIKVLLDNEVSCTNVMRFVESQGHRVSCRQGNPGQWEVLIEKNVEATIGSQQRETPVACDASASRSMVVCISSEALGRGDDELGRRLMDSYLDTLAQFAQRISHLIFINTGVRLVIEGSPVLDEIQDLEGMGVRVLSCGTCLNHFGIAERVKVGSISNMMEILEILSKAAKVINM